MTQKTSLRLHLFAAYKHEGYSYLTSFDTIKEVKAYVRANKDGYHAYSISAEINGYLENVGYAVIEKGQVQWQLPTSPGVKIS